MADGQTQARPLPHRFGGEEGLEDTLEVLRPDGSVDIYFYGPLEPFFNKTWKLNDIEKL